MRLYTLDDGVLVEFYGEFYASTENFFWPGAYSGGDKRAPALPSGIPRKNVKLLKIFCKSNKYSREILRVFK